MKAYSSHFFRQIALPLLDFLLLQIFEFGAKFQIQDSYEELPCSRAGLGGLEKFELLLDPRECLGLPSAFDS